MDVTLIALWVFCVIGGTIVLAVAAVIWWVLWMIARAARGDFEP